MMTTREMIQWVDECRIEQRKLVPLLFALFYLAFIPEAKSQDCSINIVSVSPTACVAGTYDLAVTVTYPTSMTSAIVINGISIPITGHAAGDGTGRQVLPLTGISCNGLGGNSVGVCFASDTTCNDFTTYSAPIPQTADVQLSVTTSVSNASLGDAVTMTATAINLGPNKATNTVVKLPLPFNVTVSPWPIVPAVGTFNLNDSTWTIPSLDSLGAGVIQTLTFSGTLNADDPANHGANRGPSSFVAEVNTADLPDPDSDPGNQDFSEDDIAVACITVPIELCKMGGTFNLEAPAGYASYQWFQGSQPNPSQLIGETSDTLSVTAPGEYYVDAYDADGCLVESCCPALVVAGTCNIDLAVTKSEYPLLTDTTAVNVGSNFTFRVTVENQSEYGATGVQVFDALPAGVTYVSAVASQGSYSNGTSIWTVGNLAGTPTADPNANATLDITVMVNQVGAITNVAQVFAANETDTDSTPNNDDGDQSEDDEAFQTITGVEEFIDVSLTKNGVDISPNTTSTTTTIGSEFTYDLVVSNAASMADATGVVVFDQLPGGVSYVTHTSTKGNFSALTGQWDVGTLASPESATLSITVKINQAGTIINTAQVIAHNEKDVDSFPNDDDADTDENDGGEAEDDEDAHVLIVEQFDISLDKSVAHSNGLKTLSDLALNDNVVYTIVVTNSALSTGPMTNIEVTDVLPAGVTYVSSDDPTYIHGAGTPPDYIWSIPTLAIGASATLNITATVVSESAIVNVAEITAHDQSDIDSTPDNNDGDEDDQDEVTIDIDAPLTIDLELDKTVSDSVVNVGDLISFTLALENNGTTEANNIVVTDAWNANFIYVSSSASDGAYDDTANTWSVPDLAVGETATLEIFATVNAQGSSCNAAYVTSADETDDDSDFNAQTLGFTDDDEDQVCVRAEQIDVSLTKNGADAAGASTSSTIQIGDEFPYVIQVENAGGMDDASGVVVFDQLPGTVSYVSHTTSKGSFSAASGQWIVGDLVSGAGPETLTINVIATAPGTINNSAQIIAHDQPDIDSNPNDDDDDLLEGDEADEDDEDAHVLIVEQFDISLDKSVAHSDGSKTLSDLALNDNVVYTIVVTNSTASTGAMSNIEVTDVLPAGVTYVSSDDATYAPDAGTPDHIWNIPTLAIGASATLNITATVVSESAIVNVAEITSHTENDIDSTPGNDDLNEDDQDQVVIDIDAPLTIDLELDKTVSDSVVNVGDLISFTIELENNGSTEANNIVIEDAWSSTDFTFVSFVASDGIYNGSTAVPTWSIPDLAVGETATLQIFAIVRTKGSSCNEAYVASANETDDDSTFGAANRDLNDDDEDRVCVRAEQIDLALIKEAAGVSSDDVNLGDSFTYTLVLTNENTTIQPDTATGVSVFDQLPGGVTFQSAVASQGSYSASTGIWSVGTLNPEASANLAITVTVNSPGTIENVAQVLAADQPDIDSNPNNDNGDQSEDDEDPHTINVRVIDLELDKAVVQTDGTPISELALLDAVTYTVTLENKNATNFTYDATGVIVTDLLPNGVNYVGTTSVSDGTYDNVTGLWNIGTLTNGSTATLVIEATINSIDPITNVAEVTAHNEPDIDSSPNNNTPTEDDQDEVTVDVDSPPAIDLEVAKSVNMTDVTTGQVIVFTVEVENNGTAEGTNVVLTEDWPVGLTYVSHDASDGTYDDATKLWTISDIGVGETETLQISAVVTATTGSVCNEVRVTASTEADADSDPTTDGDNATQDDEDEVCITVTQYAGLGDLVFEDNNADGDYDAGTDTPIQNIFVTLYSPGADGVAGGSDDVIVSTTSTNTTGNYFFSDLDSGCYYVEFTAPGYIPTTSLASATTPGVTNNDSDISSAGITNVVCLDWGDINPNVDAGYVRETGLGDYVWYDENRDGIQDASESGIEGIKVILYSDNDGTAGPALTDAPQDTVYTNSVGYYEFTGLTPGDYFVQFCGPTGYAVSMADNTGDDTNDSDADANGFSAVTNLSSGEFDPTLDAGYYLACLGNLAFMDVDANGVFGGTDTPLAGVTVTLFDVGPDGAIGGGDDVQVATATTDPTGQYQFCDLVAGNYYVDFNAPGYQPTTNPNAAAQGTDNDSYINTDGNSGIVAITAGTDDFTIDAGFVETTGLGDYVWYDENEDGTQDAAESGIENVKVILWSDLGTVGTVGEAGTDLRIDTTFTDATGYYEFTGLTPGDYFVEFCGPTGYAVSPLDASGDETNDSDVDANNFSASTNLSSGEFDPTLDAGYFLGCIGDLAFLDSNADGTFAGTDTPLAGVTVTLFSAGPDGAIGGGDDVQIATSTTDPTGLYKFCDLVAGNYYVDFDAPGYQATVNGTDAEGTDNDSFVNTDGNSGLVTLDPGEDELDIDAGFVQSTGLGDYVWFDENRDGAQDASESGIEGIKVILYSDNDGTAGPALTDAPQDTVYTNSVGYYEFTGLTPGDYFVQFCGPTGYAVSMADNTGDDTNDSDADANGFSAVTNLSSGEFDPTLDAGYYLACLGNLAFMDVDANGVFGGTDTPLAGVTVTLFDVGPDGAIGGGDDVQVATATTDPTGQYQFCDLVAGNYYVDFNAPGYQPTTNPNAAAQGTDNDSYINTDGNSGIVAITAGTDDFTIDAGFVETTGLGDYVWYDENEDGTQDAAESGIENVKVILWSDLGTVGTVGEAGTDLRIDTTFTDATGYYEFTGLTPGDYFVEFCGPTGYAVSPLDASGDETNDSDVDANNFSASTNLSSGEFDPTLDAGYFLGCIGDLAFLDSNADGTFAGTDTPLAGVTVTLFSAGPDGAIGGGDDVQIATSTTDPTGLYKFCDLVAGNYYVDFDAPGYQATVNGTDAEGTDNDSFVNTDGNSGLVTLDPGEDELDIDAGFVQSTGLGDYVWFDENRDGAQDASESGIEGIKVILYSDNDGTAGPALTDAPQDTVYTNSVGYYEFTGLTPGDYFVQFCGPTGYAVSMADNTGDDTNDSDADANGFSAVTNLSSGEFDPTLDAGYYLACLGNLAFMDVDANGVFGGTDTPLAGVTVTLFNVGPDGAIGGGDDVQVATATTDPTGQYQFCDLVAGNYYVDFNAPGYQPTTNPNAAAQGTDNDSYINTDGNSGIVAITAGTDDFTIDAGFVETTGLGDYVWYDENEDGTQDAAESGIENVKVILWSDLGTVGTVGEAGTDLRIDTTFTDATGYYEFTGLTPGDYFVEFCGPTGYAVSPLDASGDETNDSDVDANNFSASTNLSSGEFDPTLDAGYFLGCIGDLAFLDSNADGTFAGTDTPLAGVTVTLFSAGPDGAIGGGDDVQIATSTTDPTGLYKFCDLVAGNYYVDFDAPGYQATVNGTDAEGTDNDSFVNTDGNSGLVTLDPGEDELDIDAGFVQSTGLGDYVWFDENRDGAQDASESGIEGIKVILYSDNDGTAGPALTDAPQDTVYTNSVGYYEFTGLTPGDYFVQFCGPTGYAVSMADNTGDDTNDSDTDANGFSAVTNLSSGEFDPTLDAGYYLACLGNLAFMDVDANGVFGGTDTPLAGVTVTLFNVGPDGAIGGGDDVQVATATTDPTGQYQFCDLVAGNYYVDFNAPGYQPTTNPNTAAQGTDNDSYINTDGNSGIVAITAGTDDFTIDAGFVETTGLGDYVWYDENEDGTQDAAESGIENVKVILWSDLGTVGTVGEAGTDLRIDTTFTDATGYYEFTGLTPGDYFVEFCGPTGYAVSPLDASGDETNDSDVDANNFSASTNLSSGEFDPTLDAGYFLGCIGDLAFLDSNADGTFAGTDTPLAGVTVTLFSAGPDGAIGGGDDVQIATSTTDPTGLYKFCDLVAGNYYVDFDAPGYQATVNGTDAEGTDNDSFVNTDGNSGLVTLDPGEDELDIDAGFVQSTGLGDYVWFDENRDGAQDASESGIEGIKVILYSDNDGTAGPALTDAPQDTVYTNSVGYYEFTGLTPGDYFVQFCGPTGYAVSMADNTGDDTNDSDADANGFSAVTNLSSGEFDPTLDAGYYLACLGNLAFMDVDANGVFGGTDTPLAGVTVTLFNVGPDGAIGGGDDVQVATATTDPTGQYQFCDLVAGNYYVDFNAPGYQPTTNPNAAAQGTDNDSYINTDGNSGIVAITAGTDDFTIDAGFVETTGLGDYVWYDENEDGTQDAAESGIENVKVILWSDLGTVGTVGEAGTDLRIDTTYTDATGYYEFTGLTPGDYFVEFCGPTGYAVSPLDASGDETNDSDVDANNFSASTNLSSGEFDPTLDAGYFLACLGNLAFLDSNADGLYNIADGDTPLSGVELTLYAVGDDGVIGGGDDVEVATATTDPTGLYNFCDLVAGDYYVDFNADGYEPTINTNGTATDADNDSYVTPEGTSGVVTITAGVDEDDVDAGFTRSIDLELQKVVSDSVVNVGDLISFTISIENSGTVEANNVVIEDLWNSTNFTMVSFIVSDGIYNGSASPPTWTISDIAGGETETLTLYAVVNTAGISCNEAYVIDADEVDPDSNFTTRDLADDDEDIVCVRANALACLGNLTFIDTNADGIFNSGDQELPGVDVTLYSTGTDGLVGGGDDLLIANTTSDPDGLYSFCELQGDTYYVVFDAPGYEATINPNGDATTADDDSFINTDGNSGPIVLSPGVDDWTIDAGFVETTGLGDYVWYDVNEDGTQDAAESGIEGIKVVLWSDDGDMTPGSAGDLRLDTTYTDATGYYDFKELLPGDYFVEFCGPDGYAVSPLDASGDEANDSDVDADNFSAVTNLESGEFDPTIDAGYFLACLGDLTFMDVDGNGLFDGADTPLSGVTVTLYGVGPDGVVGGGDDVELSSTVTDPTGLYQFCDLVAGDYYVDFNAPGFEPTTNPNGTTTDVDNDSYINTDGNSGIVSITAGVDEYNVDAGFIETTGLGDYVWYDENEDGIQDPSENGIEAVKVILWSDLGDGAPNTSGDFRMDTTYTDATGYYEFTELVPGDYFVEFCAPEGYAVSPLNAGDDANDSDVDINNFSGVTNLSSGEFDPTLDAGYFLACVGNLVFLDSDGNGIFEAAAGDTPLSEVTVTLYSVGPDGVIGGGDDMLLNSTTTDPTGLYQFCDLLAGDYYVDFNAPGFQPTLNPNADATVSDDDSFLNTDGNSGVVTITAGVDDNTIDAGFILTTGLGDYVWYDKNEDGVQDIEEDGIENVKVVLWSDAVNPGIVGEAGDTKVDTTYTDGTGYYEFTGLTPGDYFVEFCGPEGYAVSPINSGGDDASDSDVDATNFSGSTNLSSGEFDPTLDAGYYLGSIGNLVWLDSNGNGIWDVAEQGIPGMEVFLYKPGDDGIKGTGDDELAATTFTQANGFYLFEDLKACEYFVLFDKNELSSTVQSTLSPDATDSDSDVGFFGSTEIFTLAPGQDQLNIDAGFIEGASIGDFVWYDLDGDGIQDAGETGIPGVDVCLYDNTNALLSTVSTDTDGEYMFTGLPPREYIVEVKAGPDGYTVTTSTRDTVILEAGEVYLEADFGFEPPADLGSIGDYVWYDLDSNAVQNPGEIGIPNVDVYLCQSGVSLDTAVTDGLGYYLFPDLPAGSYEVKVGDGPDGYTLTTPLADTVNLLVGQDYQDADFGFIPPADLGSIGDLVWEDYDLNGQRDPGEPGIDGIKVCLYMSDSTTIVDSTYTAGGGFYLFPDLDAGDYVVQFKLPEGYIGSPQIVNTQDGSDAHPEQGFTDVITLLDGEDTPYIDAGIYKTGAIGDYVWMDLNFDGIQDTGEPALDGITVYLCAADGVTKLDSTVTVGGLYLFDDLIHGDYIVKFDSPDNCIQSPQTTGTTDGSDADENGSVTVALGYGEENLSIDAGFFKYSTIDGVVWEDQNEDGDRDDTERLIDDVPVYLCAADGITKLDSAITVAGYYLFDSLFTGEYIVKFGQPDGFIPVVQTVGTVDGSDASETDGSVPVLSVDPGVDYHNIDAGFYTPCTDLFEGMEDPFCDPNSVVGDVGKFCIPLTPEKAAEYIIFVDGSEYTGPLAGCDLLRASDYNLFNSLGASFTNCSDFTVQKWTVDGAEFGPYNFSNFDQLAAWMQLNNASGNWTYDNNTSIIGGDQNVDYGLLEILTNCNLGLAKVAFNVDLRPQAIEIDLDPTVCSEVKVVKKDNSECESVITVCFDCKIDCSDIFAVETACLEPGTGTDPNMAGVCAQIAPEDVNDYRIFVDGLTYTGALAGCDPTRVADYNIFNSTTASFRACTNFRLDEWTVDGTTYGPVDFSDFDELEDYMNAQDPAGNWVYDGSTSLGGGNKDSEYGELRVFSYCNLGIAVIGYNIDLIPQAVQIDVDPSSCHWVTIEKIGDPSCVDSIYVCCDVILAVDDFDQTNMNDNVIVEVLDNDQSSQDMTTCEIVTDPLNGEVEITANGSLDYKPADGFVGLDSMQYKVCTALGSDMAWVYIDVLPVCEEVFTDNAVTIDADACGDLAGPANFCIPLPGSEVQNYNIYVDAAPYTGQLVGCNEIRVSDYNLKNSLGASFDDCQDYVLEKWTVNGTEFGPFNFDTFDNLTVWMNSNDPTGSWAFDGSVSIDGGNPDSSYGDLEIKINCNLGQATVGYNTDLVPLGIQIELDPNMEHWVTVAPKADAACADSIFVSFNCPANTIDAVDDAFTGDLNSEITGNILTNDIAINPTVNETPIEAPVSGQLVINPDGTFTYTPSSDFSGTDSFVYEICDGAQCDTARVTLTIAPSNAPPVTEADYLVTNEDVPVQGNAITNDSDPEGTDLVLNTTPVLLPANGTAILTSTGEFTYTPNTNFNGEDFFIYQVCDNGNPMECATDTVFITVNPMADPPLAEDDTYTLSDDSNDITGDLTDNDSDPDGEEIIVVIEPILPPSNGTIDINPDGTFVYTPNPGFVGSDSMIYQVCDVAFQQQCSQATVYFDVDEPLDVVIFKGFSPNGDNNNDTWIIDGIQRYPNSIVKIYNRWGNLVWSEKGYDNVARVFLGESNTGMVSTKFGTDALPDGTYFYVIDFNDESRQIMSGYVVIHR